MKYFAIIFLMVFLASCGVDNENKDDIINDEEKIIESTLWELNDEIAAIENDVVEASIEDIKSWENEIIEQPVAQNKVIKLQTKYNNPQQEVLLDIEYSLDSDNKIATISAVSPNYDGVDYFNANVQVLIGKTLAEAVDAEVTGGSLTTPAFKQALKSQLK